MKKKKAYKPKNENLTNSLTITDIKNTILPTISKISKLTIDELKDDILIREGINVDSLQIMEILSITDQVFNIKLSEKKLYNIETLSDYYILIKKSI